LPALQAVYRRRIEGEKTWERERARERARAWERERASPAEVGEEKERRGGEQEMVGLERREKDGGLGGSEGFIDTKQDLNVGLGGGG
jgi:hypothetical protein